MKKKRNFCTIIKVIRKPSSKSNIRRYLFEGDLKARSTVQGQSVKAEAMAVRRLWADNAMASCSSSSSTHITNNGFNLPYANNGYYVKVSSTKKATTGDGELKVYAP